MKFNNRYQTPGLDRPKWELTEAGFLRCKARVLATRIMPYGREELEGLPEDFQNPMVNMLVHMDDMAEPESIRSLEGTPVVAGEHNWLDPVVVREYTVGSVAGTPRIEGEYLVVELLITDPDAIRDIQEGALVDISAAYEAMTNFQASEHNGSPYDAKQQNIRYNHIAILPEGTGRAGRDVKIFNKNKTSKEEGKMADEVKVRVRLKNSGKMVFTNEAGAEALSNEETMVAENMEAESGKSATSLETTMNELETKNGELEALQAEVDSLKGELATYKTKLDELLAGDAVGEAAENMVAEQEEAGEILENMAMEDDEDGKKKEEVMNSLKGLRGTDLHSAVLTHLSVKIENMSPDALKGAFKAQHQIMNSMKGKGTAVAGTKMMGTKVIKVENKGFASRPAHERLGFKAPAK